MKILGPDAYQLSINDRKVIVNSPSGENHFVAPATSNKTPKLYIASYKGKLSYVGVTSQSMSARIRGGMTDDGAHGYHGYAWGKKNHTICLDIWYLKESHNPTLDLETIEAEIVFLYRHESGQWPIDQTEIHFHTSNEEHRKCAAEIIASLKQRCQ